MCIRDSCGVPIEEASLPAALGSLQFITRESAGQLVLNKDERVEVGRMGGAEPCEFECEFADSRPEPVRGDTETPGKLGSACSKHVSMYTCTTFSGYLQFASKQLQPATARRPWDSPAGHDVYEAEGLLRHKLVKGCPISCCTAVQYN